MCKYSRRMKGLPTCCPNLRTTFGFLNNVIKSKRQISYNCQQCELLNQKYRFKLKQEKNIVSFLKHVSN